MSAVISIRSSVLRYCLFALLFMPAMAMASETQWQHPLINNYGKVAAFPQATAQPDPEHQHRLVMDVTKGAETPRDLSPGLDKVARLTNLYALAGVPPSHVDIIAVVHGKATPAILNDQRYQSEFGMANPNTPLLKALADAGVKVEVCGQALAHHGYATKDVNKQIDVALAALLALAKHQREGYVLLP